MDLLNLELLLTVTRLRKVSDVRSYERLRSDVDRCDHTFYNLDLLDLLNLLDPHSLDSLSLSESLEEPDSLFLDYDLLDMVPSV